MLGTNQSMYIKHIIKDAFYNRGYDVAMISFRGMSGAKLTSPLVHNATTIKDIREPMNYVHNKYCVP
jgi:predicted alpha/beta-fold hydrolase